MARHFQYKIEIFFKEIILDGSLGEKKYYAIRIEFQERGSPQVHLFIWIFNAPIIENQAAYIEFNDKIINAQLSDHLNDPELLDIFIKFMPSLELAGNVIRMYAAVHMVDILLRRQLL